MHQSNLTRLITARKVDKRDKPDRREVIKEWKALARKFDGNAVAMVEEHERLAAVKEAMGMLSR